MPSILVVELTRLGDVISMLPALARFRQAYPEAEISCAVQEPYAALVAGLDLNVRAIGLRATRTFVGIARALREIRRMRPDVACAMSPAKRNTLLAHGSGAAIKAGYLRYVNARIHYLHETPLSVIGSRQCARVWYGREHLSLRALKVCEVLGIDGGVSPSQVGFRSDRMAEAGERIKPFLAGVQKPYVVLHPFASWEYKEWPTGKFVSLARRIRTEFGCGVVVVCEEGERSRWEEASRIAPAELRADVFASASLLDTAAVIRGAWAMVGNDSGPLHLAALCEIPVVGLFGPAPPDLTAPHNARGVFLYHRLQCSPCSQKLCVRPEGPCMNNIEINEVLEALRTFPAERPLSHTSIYA